MAGHADVLGPDWARREPERSETHSRAGARTKDHPDPAALPVWCPRRVLGRLGDT